MTKFNEYDRKRHSLDKVENDKVIACSTVPDVLVLNRGNISDAAQYLGCDRNTLRKYARDTEGNNHRLHVVGGCLRMFTLTGRSC